MTDRTNAGIAHLWASRDVSEGRTSNGTMFFRDNTIYSYGTHYPIAKCQQVWVRDTETGRRVLHQVCRFNSTSSSVTTEGKHKNRVRQAIPSYWEVYCVPNVTEDTIAAHLANWEHLRDEYIESMAKANRARSAGMKATHLHNALVSINAANRYRLLFLGKNRKAKELKADDSMGEMITDYLEQQQAEREAKRERQRQYEQQEYERWINGKGYNRTFPNSPVAFRISPSDSQEVETSLGATVPLDHAIRVFRMLAKLRRQGISFTQDDNAHRDRLRIGHFHIDSVDWDTDTIIAGCHTIEWKAIAEFAAKLGIGENDNGSEATSSLVASGNTEEAAV
jgi:hypothetical protein